MHDTQSSTDTTGRHAADQIGHNNDGHGGPVAQPRMVIINMNNQQQIQEIEAKANRWDE